MNERQGNVQLPVYDRALLVHGSKRNEELTLAEIEQYGRDNFGDADYVSIYGMRPRDWYSRGIRLLGRTVVECTRDSLADRIGLDVASVAAFMPGTRQCLVIDPFAGSCNTLFWILRHMSHSEGVAFESDRQIFDLTRRNLAVLRQKINLVHGDYLTLLEEHQSAKDRGVVAFVAPPWGTALDEVEGLDLGRTIPPISQIIERIAQQFPRHNIVFATQLYEKVRASSLAQLQTQFDWSEVHVYDINEKGKNHGILLGTKGFSVTSVTSESGSEQRH
jgi:16S rRNA G966 N2-methylase RsmD